MARFAAGFDASLLSGPAVSAVVADAAAIEKMAAMVKALAATWAADVGVWRRTGDRSPAHHLARTTGTTVGQAAEAIDTARRLESLAATGAAARGGELSMQQASLIAGAASDDPTAEAKLLDSAGRVSLAELRNDCAQIRANAAVDLEARRAKVHQGRYLRSFTDADGGWNMRVRNTPEVGAEVMAALAPITDRLFNEAREAGRREPLEAYAADALTELATSAHDPIDPVGTSTDDSADTAMPVDDTEAAGHADDAAARAMAVHDTGSAGDSRYAGKTWDTGQARDTEDTGQARDTGDAVHTTGPPATGNPTLAGTGNAGSQRAGPGATPGRSRRRRGAPAKIIVRVDLGALLRGHPAAGETCELVGFGPVAVSAIRDMLDSGDPFLAAVVTRGVAVAGVAHLGRRPTAHQRTALEWLYPACAVEGCPAQAHLEIDHRQDWADTHLTILDLLDRLCPAHHALKTRQGWALIHGTGKRSFVPPDDPRHPRHAHPGDPVDTG